MDMNSDITPLAERAKKASRELSQLSGKVRKAAIKAMGQALSDSREAIKAANDQDVQAASEAGLEGPMLKRLEMNDKAFDYMAKRLSDLANLPDPLGIITKGHTRPSGLKVHRVSVPLGVIGIIYESRPNVTTDAASVCVYSGNAVILRGGSEALRTNVLLADTMADAAARCGVPRDAIQIVRTPDRAAVGQLLRMKGLVDVIIPRGGKSLIKRVSEESLIPVIKHYDGICHQYVAADADIEMAVRLVLNSKLEKVEVCNALETLLVDAAIAPTALPVLADALRQRGVELRGCERSCQIVPMKPATEEDWVTEYLAPILSIRVVDGLEEAVEHINSYGSSHTDGIITSSMSTANRFCLGVDSASVLVNASTRLSGGGDYGMGAVVGISTDKLHARGPVGPEELTCAKWVAIGEGHLRE